MIAELDVQKQCQKQLCAVVNDLRKVITDQANEVKNRVPTVTEKSLILFSAVSKLSETARVILQMRTLDAVDEMHVLLRSMVELTVNACYLQQASDDEISRFFHFDPINSYIAMTDLVEAHGGNLNIPQELVDRVTRLATEASAASNLPLRRILTWSKFGTLHKRALAVDAAVGGNDVAVLMANIYTTGSGYVHASYKTIDRHARWLTGSKEEHPLRVLFGTNNAIDGVALVFISLGRYFNRAFNTNREPFNEFSTIAEHMMTVSNQDHSNHCKSEAKKAAVEA